jgi:two-component system nitrogen regulation sensor histidine kinase GlnL
MDSPSPLPPTLESLATPVAWTHLDGAIAGVNAAFCRWLEISPKRLLGQPLASLEHEDEALIRFFDDTQSDAMRLRQVKLGIPGEPPHVADGWIHRNEDGCVLEVHPADGFTMTDPAAALPGALSAALKGLAHELRNPLAGLKGAAQLLARRASQRQDAGEHELIELIGSEIERLNQLVECLMSPSLPRPHEPLNIHAVLEKVRRLSLADNGWTTRIQRDYDPSIPEFPGDPDRLTQAIWNLVRNAAEAGAHTIILRTRVESGLHIRERMHARVLRLEIIDDGRGVPEELAEHLFLPLVSGRAEGSGLGLALAHQVAREHHGSLTFRSQTGHTVFTMLLPQTPDIADPGVNIHVH